MYKHDAVLKPFSIIVDIAQPEILMSASVRAYPTIAYTSRFSLFGKNLPRYHLRQNFCYLLLKEIPAC